jgi:hypothetical protein
MRYMFLLYGDESRWAEVTPEELQEVMQAYEAFSREVTEAGAFVSGEPLEASSASTTVRVRDGEPVLSDGPFAETREQLGGYYVVDVPDLDSALHWAAKIPDAANGCVEVRPVIEFDAPAEAPDHDSAARA